MPSLNSSAALFIILSRSNAASLFGLAVVSSYVNVNLYEQYPEDNTYEQTKIHRDKKK